MERALKAEIAQEAKSKKLEFQQYHNYQELNFQRNRRRVLTPPSKIIHRPEEWGLDLKFNPFYVYMRRGQIAKSIARKILNKTYSPNPPHQKTIPKKAGGVREISVYQIPDSAVSDLFYKNLLSKNKHRFSSLSYAYRDDRNVHFAIQDIANELNSTTRIYVAEFDFSNFFNSINHDFLFEQLKKNSFIASETDIHVLKSFLTGSTGIPLGTSISLFLANVACWSLDRKLEDAGIRFARYADDTIIWSRHYSKITTAFDIIMEFSESTGIEINFGKSDGISLLQKPGLKSELHNSKDYVEFLGYKISCDNVGIKKSSILNIKKEISYILYRNLIQPINTNPVQAKTIPSKGLDTDFVTAIMQIRRYLYGSMTEETLRKYLNGAYKKLSFKGIMSFYPLVTDEEQMKELDRWLLSTILNTVKKRRKLLIGKVPGFDPNQFPFTCDKTTLLSQCKTMIVKGKSGKVQIPSFMRIYKALKLGITSLGIERVMNPNQDIQYES